MKLYDFGLIAVLGVFLIGAVFGTAIEESSDAIDVVGNTKDKE